MPHNHICYTWIATSLFRRASRLNFLPPVASVTSSTEQNQNPNNCTNVNKTIKKTVCSAVMWAQKNLDVGLGGFGKSVMVRSFITRCNFTTRKSLFNRNGGSESLSVRCSEFIKKNFRSASNRSEAVLPKVILRRSRALLSIGDARCCPRPRWFVRATTHRSIRNSSERSLRFRNFRAAHEAKTDVIGFW